MDEYMLTLLGKFEYFFVRIRWKAPFAQQNYANNKDNKEIFKFKNRTYPGAIDELTRFDDAIIGVLDKIKKKH